MALAGVAAAGLLGGCKKAAATFDSPDAAVGTLVAAVRADNQHEIKRILGPDSKEILSSGDDVADANGRAEFVRLYDEKHRLTASADDPDAQLLEVGNTAWPLPIPIVKGDKGWYFDTAAGLDEMLSRRIGRNELYTMKVCEAIADAEREFASADMNGDGWREYAERFKSDPGKKNGLYWPPAPGEPDSPLGELVADAAAEGYGPRQDGSDGPRPFHGYYYRILKEQGPAAPGGSMSYVGQGHMIGGFGVIAWPADYGNSGLKSFIINHHEILYEKDLGDDTDRIARSITTFNPDAGWKPVEDSQMR